MIIPTEAFVSAVVAVQLWQIKETQALKTTLSQVVQKINDDAGTEIFRKTPTSKKRHK